MDGSGLQEPHIADDDPDGTAGVILVTAGNRPTPGGLIQPDRSNLNSLVATLARKNQREELQSIDAVISEKFNGK